MTTKTKFTQGPWKYNANTREIGVVDKSDTQSYGMMLVVAYIDEYDHPEYAANANLITAAPELYEVLEELVEQCGHPNISGWVNIERAITALTKARGES